MTTTRLTLATPRFTRCRAAQRLPAGWATDPVLARWSPADELDALAHRDHHDHDRLVGGLVTSSQSHNDDATALLLAALRPGPCRFAHMFDPARQQAAFDDRFGQRRRSTTQDDFAPCCALRSPASVRR